MFEAPRTILVDLCHPAHVHFFRNPIRIWREGGHNIQITSRDKDVAIPLLREFDLECTQISKSRTGVLGLARELVQRDLALFRHARRVRADVITAIGGVFAAHAALLARIPSVVFYDTEIATLQNTMTYPVATRVAVPRCYSGWVPKRRQIRYDGYHELSYLHPSRFQPNRGIALQSGLDTSAPTYLLRLVAWTANHDLGDTGLSLQRARQIVERLSEYGKVIISSEAPLEGALKAHQYQGRASDLHHLMAYCAGYFGESATMASEAAVLGVPAVYAAHSPRGYTDEQESRYGLVKNVRVLDTVAIDAACSWLLRQTQTHRGQARAELLKESIDVAMFVAEQVVSTANAGR
ncbi:MAG: DUF354 domain-containing protein [Xanthomonadales bacterium]|nr:DUF354 domain-containing protein [Xanthomonadales bacterium]